MLMDVALMLAGDQIQARDNEGRGQARQMCVRHMAATL